jgi:ABC-2 type transport system ATP-binding protein
MSNEPPGRHTQSRTPDPGRIALDTVTKTYGDVRAVDGVSLTIGGGQYHCLLGPNGSGKSTILRLLLGLAQPTSGRVNVPPAVIGCGFQRPNFYGGLSVRENIHVFADLVGADDWEWNRNVVETLRLRRALDRQASELSGGYARKLDLALALIKQPDFLLLDEPLGALDDVTQELVLDFLADYAGNGNTVFVATHRVTEFESDLDRVSVMHRGSLVFDQLVRNLDLDDGESLQSFYVDTVLAREGVDSQERRTQ